MSTVTSTVSIFSSRSLRNIPNPPFMLYTNPGLQFNFPSVPSLKYDPRNEIRAPEYRVWCTTGRWTETWPDSEVKRHALVGEGRPDPPPQVVWLNICPAPLGCLDTSTQPASHHSSVLHRCNESWHGQLGTVPNPWRKVPPQCQRLREFNNLERLSFAFLKPLGQHLESHVYSKRSTDWENKCCQMIFVLPVIKRKVPSELNEQSLQTSASWCSIFITFSPLSNGRNFNCRQFRNPKAWWAEWKHYASWESDVGSPTSAH